jgi:murein L,D-transpeptidase YafK
MIMDSIEWATEQEWQQERKSMLDAIEGWRKDWESNQLERYLHHYSKTFATESVTYPQFIERKKQTAGSIGQVKVALSNFALYRYPNAGEVMLTYFDQDYRTPGVTQFLRKKMYWQKEQGKWKIIYEGTT